MCDVIELKHAYISAVSIKVIPVCLWQVRTVSFSNTYYLKILFQRLYKNYVIFERIFFSKDQHLLTLLLTQFRERSLG